jgi:2-methylcitrate dehydratase PrpD
MENQTISDRLASFVVNMTYEDLPKPMVEKAKQVILDTFGAIIAAASTEKGKAMASYFSSIAREGKSTMFGTKQRFMPEMASYANGSYGHMLEFDDGHRPSGNHLACVAVPSAFAVCETEEQNGADFITAFVAAYEILGRVGRAVVLPRWGQRFHGTGTCGTFGAAAAAGKSLHLNQTQMANALGIAGTASSGLSGVAGFDCKPLHAGRAAFNGVTSAYLARKGIEGPRKIIEGEHGFCRAMTPEFTFDPILTGLGSDWEIAYAGFKMYSTCSVTFTSVESLLEIMKKNKITPDQIASIRVGVPPHVIASESFSKRVPTNESEARFSVVYAVAAGALNGRVGMHEIDEKQIGSPDSLRMIERIDLALDKEAEEVDRRDRDNPIFFSPAAIDVFTKDGRHFRLFKDSIKGYDPIVSPLTSDEVADKFRSLASFGLTDRQADAVVDIVYHLEEQKDLLALSQALIG